MNGDVQGSSVLIVDDSTGNLRLPAAVPKRGGLVPRPVPSGRLAGEAAVADPPAPVLRDVSLPEMSGVKVCRWFQQDERLRNIPVIFVSGLHGVDDKDGTRLDPEVLKAFRLLDGPFRRVRDSRRNP